MHKAHLLPLCSLPCKLLCFMYATQSRKVLEQSSQLKEGSSALLCFRRVCRRSATEEANTVEHSGQLKEGSSALLCCRRVCRRSAAEEANTVEQSGKLAGWYRARTGMEGLKLEACGEEDSLLVSGKEVLFVDFFFFFVRGLQVHVKILRGKE